MKKRIGIIILFMLLALGAGSCGNRAGNDDVKQAKQAENVEKQEDEEGKVSEEIDNDIEEKKKAEAETEKNKESYIEKLDNIEKGIEKDLKEGYDSGVTAAMMASAREEYKRWDDGLNEIYSVLKTQLSADEMSKLEKEQIQWISDKEKKAEEESAEVKGGTMEPLIYTALAGTTKERCYELVEKYMKE